MHRFGSSIKLKVILPVGKGRPVDVSEVLDAVKRDDTETFDEKLINKFLKSGTGGEYETVGSYKHIAAGDALVSVDVSKDEMHGTITVDPPAMGGADCTFDLIDRSLKAQESVPA